MPFVGKNNLTAKERLYGEAILNQTRREREKAQQEAEEKARRWASLQMDNADKGPMPSPREMISLGGQALTSGTVQTAADAIQRMRQQMLEQEQRRKEAERLRELYQPKTDRTAKDLAGMRLDAGDFAKVGGQALTSGTVQSAAKSLGSYKQSKQPSGPVKVDPMGVSSERDARLELLNENLRRLEDQRKMQEAKAAPNQEERQAQQEAFWRDRALSTGYSPNSSVQMSTRQQEAAEKAGALKNQERELGQYIKYLEGQGVQDRAQNAVTERDVQRGLNSTIEKGDITTGNEKVRSLARAIQYGKLGLEPRGFDETDISANMKWADALTERQKDTILAFAGREDWDGAQRYLNSISDQLNQKVAESEYTDLGTAGKALYWAPAGIDQFASGIAQLGNSEARNRTVTNRVSQMVQQDAYDTHPALGFAYDMGTSISNMTPSILLSAVAGPALGAAGLSASTAGAVAGGIGSAALGASAGGNAYAEKRRQGYSEDEAAAYATMVGASEAGLQYVLGGISKLGATPLAKATEMVSKIDNAFGQAAIKLGANMLSEGVEEGLQSVLEPAFATLILDEKYQVSPQEVVTSFLMGALTAGLLEGMGAVRAGRAGKEVARNGGFDATAVDGYMGESGVDYFRGVSNLEEASQGLDILDDYYGLSQGKNEDIRADVERQYAMRSAWYEGRDQARRATEQTATEETQQDNVGQEWTQVDTNEQGWTQVDTNGQNGTPDTQAAEPEGLRLGAMWEDAKSQTAQGTPQETAGADQTARLVQEARDTLEAARAAQEDQGGEPEGLRLGAMWEDAQNQEGQFQRVQPVNTAQPEGLTLGAMWADNEASNPKNLNEGAGVNGREEDAAPAAGAATPAGRGLLDGGPGRVYGQGPGQQAGVVEEGPAGADQTSEQSRTAALRYDRAANLRGQEVSSRQLGLSRGTDTANVLVMPRELWDTEMVQVAQDVQARTGATVTYVLGNMKVAQTDGSVGTVRGVQMPGKIIVQANHAKLSVGQIAKHEEFHVYAGRDPAMVREAEARIKAKYDEAEFNNVVATYIQKLQGVIDIPANGTVEQINEAFYRIMEEIYADAYAGINAFGVQASQYQETIQELIQERESAKPSLENAQATERTTGPTSEEEAGERLSVEDEEMLEEAAIGDDGHIYLPGQPMPEAVKRQRAKDTARSQEAKSQEKFSVEDEDILMEAEIGDDGNIYLPGGPAPGAVKRRRAAEQGANTTEQSTSVVEQGGASEEESIGTEAQVKKKKATGKKPLKGTKPVAQSKAIIAKKDLRQTMMSLFSIPDGKKQMAGEIIERYADKMIRDGELTYEDRNALFNRLYEEGVVTVEADDLYREGRRAVAKGRVYVNEKVKGEFSDDWNDFRRRAFAAGIYLTNNPSDATPDSWNVELSQSFPGLFDPGELSERTILERIVEVAEEGKAEKMTLAEYTASMVGQEFKSLDDAMEGIERQMDWALRTFAEKANLELYLRDRTGKKIQQEREASAEARRDQAIRNQAARAKERETRRKILERQRERREMSELQQKTLKQLQWLSKNRYRAPNELKKQFDEVLGDIDVLAAHAANEMNWSKKYQATWKDLRQMYLTAKKEDPNFLPSPELERIVNRLDGDKLADMDVEALGDLYRAAVGLRTEFYNRNNVLGSQKGELFSEVYRDAVDEITGSPKKLPGERGTVAEAADTFFNSELLTPMNVLHRMAGWAPEGAWHDMAAQLERGERDVRRYYVKANRMLEDFLKENEAWVKTADGQGKDGVWYELEVPQLLELNMGDKPIFGDTVKVYMTPAQKVHLYLESKSPENLRHIAMGGRTFANREIYAKGKRKEAFAAGKTIRLAPESVKKIVSDMTEQEMALANILEHYYNDFAKEEMNRVSNVLIGYDKAVSQNYAPIYTNENYSKSEIGVYESKAETVSRSKSRQEYASNATYNMSAFEAFERHVDDISRYVGMAIPARNWQTLMNWQVKDGSMKDSISHQWGQEGVDYINELLTDLQTSRRPDSSKVGKFWDKVVSKYISFIFGLNPSIVLKQLGSIPLAMPYLGVSSMPGPVKVAKIDRELIRTYTQDLDYRLLGYSMPETKILKENPGKLQTNKLLNFAFGGGAITATDGWAASVLWPWAENKVRKEQPDLMVGTQEMIESGQSPFYKAVAEEFEQAVSRSQSTTATLFSSRMRRSKHPVSRALTLFKTDAAQGYNTIRQVVGEAQYYARKGDKRMANRQKLRLGQAVVGLLAGYLWLEGINLIMELWKRQGDKYKDEEGNLQAESMAEDLVMGVVTSMFGLVPVAGEAAEFIASKMTGDQWYGMEVMGVEQFNEWLQYLGDAAGGIQETLVGAVDIVSNGGNLPKYLSDSSEKILSWIRDAAKATGQAFGIPVSNLETYSLGLMKWVSPAIATEYENMLGRGTKGNLKGLHGASLVARTQYILERRAGEVSIETAELLAELYEAGMANAIPAEPTYKLKTDTGEREMTAAERQLYDAAWSEVGKDLEEMVQSQEFQGLDRAGKTSALKTLYDYAKAKADEAVNPEHEVEAWEEAVDTILREGGTIGEWAALKAATKDMSSAEKYRTIANSDMGEDAKVAAIGSVMGMEMETASGNPSQYAKMLDILDNGATLTEYLDLLDHGEEDAFLDQIKAGADISASMYLRVVKAIEAVDDNGRISQAEAEEGLRRISGLTNEERAELWQLQDKRWKPEKNPFDVEAGRRILEMVKK